MKANFPLSNIEFNVEDDLLERAELLEAGSAIKSVSEVDKNIWVAKILDNDEWVEAEVQLSGSKVRTFTCECSVYKKYTICQHIAATLIYLRRQKIIEKEAQEAKSSIKKTLLEAPVKLTIPNILKRVDTAQLLEFVADYARQDKQFALALKTRFTGDLAQGNLSEYYKTLMDNALRGVKNAKGKLTPKGWLQFFTMLDEIKQKSESLFKTGELQSSFDLIQLALPLVHRYLRSYDSPHHKLSKRQILFLEILRGYSQVLMSPELTERIWDFMLNEYTLNVKHLFSEIIFDWIMKHADADSRVDRVLQAIENQIIINKGLFDTQDRLLTHKIQLLQKNGRIEEAGKMILGASQNPDVLLFAVQNSMDNRDWSLAKNLATNGLKIFSTIPAVTDVLEDTLLRLAEKEGDTEGVLLFAEKRFRSTLKLEYFHLLKKNNISASKLKSIIQFLEQPPYKIERRDAVAAIYFYEKKWDDLVITIQKHQSLELLRRYGYDIWKNNATVGFDLHKKIIYEYLSTHLGRPPAQRIRTILENHIEKGGQLLTNELMGSIKIDFPERHSLKEEFTDMLSELEKKGLINELG